MRIQYKRIEGTNDFASIENTLTGFYEQVPTAVNKKLEEIWEHKQNLTQAGVPEGVIAASFLVELPLGDVDIKDCNERDIIRNTKGFFQEMYGESNLISFRSLSRPDFITIQVLLYPLMGRVLRTSNIEQRGILNINIEADLAKYIEQRIGIELIKMDKAAAQETAKKVDLIRMREGTSVIKFPEQDEELIYDAKGRSAQANSSMSMLRLEDIINKTLKCYTTGSEKLLFIDAQKGLITPEKYLNSVTEYLRDNYPEIKQDDINIVLDKIYSAVFGNYILDVLLNDSAVSDIKVIAYNKIRVKVSGQRMTSNLHFLDDADLARFIDSLALRNKLDLRVSAINVFTDTITNPSCIMRFNITTPYINSSSNFYLHIRKIPKEKYSIKDLIRFQMMPPEVAEYLTFKAKEGKGIIFTGKGASGKTTLMNVLLDKIPYNKSGLVIQESEELFSTNHPDIMFQHIMDKEGYKPYSLQDEAKNGLLTDLDYFIIGEVKGAEAMYFINAAATGHRCWCSVHSANSKEAINKLADYVMYESKYNKADALYMLKELEVVVYMENFKVKEISEVVGWNDEKQDLIFHEVYRLNAR